MKIIHFHCLPSSFLALLIITGICVIAIGVVFIWYKRKTSLTSSTVGNLIKLIPSLNEKIPTLNSLLPILLELTPSHNDDVISPVAVSHPLQTPPDEPHSTTYIGSKTSEWKPQNLQPSASIAIPSILIGTIIYNYNQC